VSDLKEAIKYFESLEFDVCCSGFECGCRGMPVDPDYYILQRMIAAQKKIDELEKKLAEAYIYLDNANDKIDSLIGELDGVVSSQNWLRASGYKRRLSLEEKGAAR